MRPSTLDLVEACRDSYLDSPPRAGDELIEIGQDACLVRECGDRVVIAFRGTDEAEDWKRNFNVGDLEYHEGFARASTKFLDDVQLTWFNHSLCSKTKKELILTGHSLGGAMADFVSDHTGVPAVTFGGPRVWKKSWSTDDNLTRYVASGDPVPYVPLLLQGFRHRGSEILLTKRGARPGKRSILGRLLGCVNGGYYGRAAHDIDRYVDLVKRADCS